MTKAETDTQEYRSMVKTIILADASFRQMVFSNLHRPDQYPWHKIKVRPVFVKGQRQIQFSYFDSKKDITKNYSGAELETKLDEVLAIPFGQINIQTATGETQVRFSKQGKISITRNKSSHPAPNPDLSHDRTKRYPLAADKPDPFLQDIGIMSKQGKVLAAMQGKFIQINEFLRIIEQTAPQKNSAPIEIIDCGCGSAYLTFAAYHFLNNIRQIPVHVFGIDRNNQLIEKCRRLRDTLGWTDLEFDCSTIADYHPKISPDMVLSLHACDTATDQVIAQGILWKSQIILAAPCCQHELHNQLHAELFRPVTRHGILKERLSDLLTDAFRALVLRIMGYNTSVIEFVSPENTAKNLLIRAEKGPKSGEREFINEYRDLKNYWQVVPVIETLLGEEFQKYFS